MRRNRKIRVLFTIKNFDTAGGGKALLKVAQRLNPDFFEPHIACLHSQGAFFKVVENSGIPVHIIDYLHPMDNRLKGLMHCLKVAKMFRRIKPDIIHSYNYGADYSEGVAVRLAGAKWVYTKKNMNWGGASSNSWRLRTLLANRIAYQNRDMKELFFPGEKKAFYIPRGVDVNEFSSKVSPEKIKEEFSIQEQETILMCVANLEPVKKVEVLIEAFNELQKIKPDLRLFIVGEYNDEYGDSLLRLAFDTYRLKNVIFTGKRFDINAFLQLCDIFVLPSKMEGSPVAMLEAMASGCLVLGSAVPGIRDQLAEFPELLFKAEDAADLKDKLMQIVNMKPSDQAVLKNKMVNYVTHHLNINLEVKKHEELYHSMLKRN